MLPQNQRPKAIGESRDWMGFKMQGAAHCWVGTRETEGKAEII